MNMQNNVNTQNAADRARKKGVELLCPAGSPAAFDAAIEGGASAIYLGTPKFNARINAKNFTPDELRSSIERAHAYGVKVYITLNTLVYDKELRDVLRMAQDCYLFGADALIVADIGVGALIKKHIPELELHASTQFSGHSTEAARLLASLGYSRMVCAREMSREDLAAFCASSPIEAEVFVHGALCVCHSGQCLFSSLVGARSGNRGECAQPCRLPYMTGKNEYGYPLSLRDLSLAAHVRELADMGVASFKIEGRMKSPEYVRDTARIFRTLIDENRNADKYEMRELERIFSRGGFTDGYFTKSIGSHMLGTRSESDKENTRSLEPFEKITRKIPITLEAKILKGQESELRILPYNISVKGDVPLEAINAPLDLPTVERALAKLGNTPYVAEKIDIQLGEGLMLPISRLNALRRDALDRLAESSELSRVPTIDGQVAIPRAKAKPVSRRTACFFRADRVTPLARSFFDIIYLPLESFDGSCEGVMLPSVIYDSELDSIRSSLKRAKALGAKYALAENIAQISYIKEAELIPHGDFRLNITNSASAEKYEALGLESLILSPELTLPRLRDIGGATSSIVYGRIPLMVTEKCVGREISDCSKCKEGSLALVDRRNVAFPVLSDASHRSIIFNSVPIYMADKQDELEGFGVVSKHFIFSCETQAEVDRVIDAYKKGLPPHDAIRRIVR